MLLVQCVCCVYDLCGEFNAPFYAHVCTWSGAFVAYGLGWMKDLDPKFGYGVGVLQCKTVLDLSSDITSNIFRVLLILYTILLNNVTQNLWRYTSQTLKGLVTSIQNKRKLPNLALYNASQIIKSSAVHISDEQSSLLHYLNCAWFVATWMEWGLCRPNSIVKTVFACNNGIALNTICFISRGAKYQKMKATLTIDRTRINVTHNPVIKSLAGNNNDSL